MAITLKGPWNKGQIDTFLQNSTFPLRLACVGDDGFPRVVSVWYGYDGQRFRCVSHRSSQLVSLLERCDRVGFELAPSGTCGSSRPVVHVLPSRLVVKR